MDLIAAAKAQVLEGRQLLQDGETVYGHQNAVTATKKQIQESVTLNMFTMRKISKCCSVRNTHTHKMFFQPFFPHLRSRLTMLGHLSTKQRKSVKKQ